MGTGTTGKIGGLLKLLFVLIVVVLAIGLWRSWFSFSMKSNEKSASTNTTTKVTMTIDQNRLREDATAVVEAAQKGVQELQEKAKGLQNGSTVAGKVTSINRDENRLTVKNGDAVTLHVTKETTITKGESSLGFKEIKPDDRVRVTYRKTESANHADSITIQPPRKEEEKKTEPDTEATSEETTSESGQRSGNGQ